MQIQLTAPSIWLADKAVDFRKSITGLTECVIGDYGQTLENQIYIFYNRARDKLKILARHGNGSVLIYKSLDKKKFTIVKEEAGLIAMQQEQLAWMLAGLDWVEMSSFEEIKYEDYF